MDSRSFLLGAGFGFLVAGVLGFVLQRIHWLRGRVGAFGRSQTVMQDTNRTPAEVARDSLQAFVGCVFWGIVLLVVLAGIGWVLYGVVTGRIA